DTNFAGGEKHTISGLLENRREHFSFDSSILQFFTPADIEAARNGYSRTTNSVGGEYVLDLLRTGTTISVAQRQDFNEPFQDEYTWRYSLRSEEHTSELQSRGHLVCRLLLEKKKKRCRDVSCDVRTRKSLDRCNWSELAR